MVYKGVNSIPLFFGEIIMKKIVAILIAILVFLCFALPVFAEESTTEDSFYMPNQGAEGEIMYLASGDELEIQLGSAFAYHGFKLELDYGTYPYTIYADEYGTLKLEIGGSDKYVIRHTGEIFDPSETTTFHIIGSNGEGLEPSTESTDGSADLSQEDASKDLSTSNEPEETETIESDKEKNDSEKKFPIGVVVVIVVLVFLGGGAYIIERKSKTKK